MTSTLPNAVDVADTVAGPVCALVTASAQELLAPCALAEGPPGRVARAGAARAVPADTNRRRERIATSVRFIVCCPFHAAHSLAVEVRVQHPHLTGAPT